MRDDWSITLDGTDTQDKPMVMVRRNGEPWTRTFSVSEARHLVNRYASICSCECNRGGFCGGCGHAGCGGR